MKKIIFVLVVTLSAINYLQAQTTETLTNSSVIKMVKAKLSDELIIDEIINSKVNFNMSVDSMKVLTNENVSSQIIQAMRTAYDKQEQSTVHSPQSTEKIQQPAIISQPPTVNIQPPTVINPQAIENIQQPAVISQPATVNIQQPAIQIRQTSENNQESAIKSGVESKNTIITKQETSAKTETNNKIEDDNSNIRINLISYVNPLKQLIIFFDNQFSTLSGISQKWNKQINDSLEREKQIKRIIAQDEKEITDKMNSNAKGFSNEILNLKNKLVKDRETYRRFKNDMTNLGKNISEQLKTLSNETDRKINDKFSEVSRMIIKSNSSPTMGDTINMITITKQRADTNLLNYVSPVNVILNCYTNEISPICETIEIWNKKALMLIQQDAKLAKQLEPLNTELQQYESKEKSVRKLNKQHITDLKKQCKSLNDDRNQLAKQMSDDRDNLSERLNQINKEFSVAVKDRFNNAMENIDYMYEK